MSTPDNSALVERAQAEAREREAEVQPPRPDLTVIQGGKAA